MLGGKGILVENRVARHMADLEGLHTYEGDRTRPGPHHRPLHHRHLGSRLSRTLSNTTATTERHPS
jgi:hypothetical protein